MRLEFTQAAIQNNPALVQLLGLCPLLAVSNTITNALGLALASGFVVIGSNVCISCLRHVIPQIARLAVFVLVIATFTTVTVLLLEAYAYDLYTKIALFVQIIVTNCMILGRAEQFASRHSVVQSTWDAIGTAFGFAVALVGLGLMREVLGQGTLFADAHTLFGTTAQNWTVQITPRPWLPLASYAPGAFIVAGITLALLKSIHERRKTQTNIQPPAS